ncbi:MAG: hypothetical protein P1V35_11495 [Planctomycetota bacterium]|nr:hypothetical protein [Planctomycetota bacterium]
MQKLREFVPAQWPIHGEHLGASAGLPIQVARFHIAMGWKELPGEFQ